MYKVTFENLDYRIIEHTETKYKRTKTEYILENKYGGRRNHTKFKRYKPCRLLIDIMDFREIPEDKSLQKAIIRVSNDINYVMDIKFKQTKVNNKLQCKG